MDEYGGDELPNVFDGAPHEISPFILPYSLILFLLLIIIFIFLRFRSHSVLHDRHYTWNSRFRVRSPRSHSHQFRLTNFAIVASPFVYPHLSARYQ